MRLGNALVLSDYFTFKEVDELKILGILVGKNKREVRDKMWEELISGIERRLNFWKLRTLNLKGKVLILNVLMVSKLWYVLHVYDMPVWTVQRLKRCFLDFLWEGKCEVKKLQGREYLVSFMHLPVYLEDNDINTKLEGSEVIPVSTLKRRCYPGTDIEDGTRFIKIKFQREVASLLYSTRFETAERSQYFWVMDSKQVQTCRMCMSPEHILKNCPDFKGHKCEEHGHFARECNAVKCSDCFKTLNKCECWMQRNEEEEEKQYQVNRQMHSDATGTNEPDEEEEQSGTRGESEGTNEEKGKNGHWKEDYQEE